jgi:hypothetical protein
MKNKNYYCPAGIVWVKNSDGILVVQGDHNEPYLLMGLESALWSWMNLSYTFSRLVSMLAELEGISRPAAGRKLMHVLENWRGKGILEEREIIHG